MTIMPSSNWRTPLVILICGGIILTLSLGTRHSFGLYLQPMTLDLGWNRQTFAIALAIQNLVYGLATPIAGMITDKYGAARVLVGGTLLYAIGLVLMAYSTTGLEFSLSAGLLVGSGLSCSGFAHRLRRGRPRLSAGQAHHGAGHRRRRRLVRAVRDAALRPGADQPDRLAQRAADLRGDRVADPAALHRPRGRQENRRRRYCKSSPSRRRCARRSATAATCCSAPATSCAASSSCSSRCTSRRT